MTSRSPTSLADMDISEDDAIQSIDALSLPVAVVEVMIQQERAVYKYEKYRPKGCETTSIKDKWRQDICHWTYSVVDHFDLSRETVAISLSLFDRFMATQGNTCSGDTALLTSLATLFISVKINETKNLRLSTLANLSRNQFSESDITRMERKILETLSWRVNPPTHVGFVSHLLRFLSGISKPVRRDIFELSRYLCELSSCDSYFVQYNPSSVAYGAILYVFDYISTHRLPLLFRKYFNTNMSELLGLSMHSPEVIAVQRRMEAMFASSMELYAHDGRILASLARDQDCDSRCNSRSSPVETHNMTYEQSTSIQRHTGPPYADEIYGQQQYFRSQ